MEADIIFNNPALSIELGLVDIARYHVEVMDIIHTKTIWGAFVVPSYTLLHLALVRGDAFLVSKLLSSGRFDCEEGQVLLKRLMLCAVTDDCIGAEAFSTFVPVNYTYSRSAGEIGIPTTSGWRTDTPLSRALVRLAANSNNRAETDNVQVLFYEDSIKDLRAKKVLALVDAGADTHLHCPNLGGTPLDFARKRFTYSSDSPLWREVFETMGIGFLL